MSAALTKCSETRDIAIVHLLSLEKQSKQGRICGFFKIPKFFEDKELYPVLALQTYFSKVRSANFELFILQRLLVRFLRETSYYIYVVCSLYVIFLLPPERAPKVLAPSLFKS